MIEALYNMYFNTVVSLGYRREDKARIVSIELGVDHEA